MIDEFFSIHNHSHFSMLDGISLPEEMVKVAKEKGLRRLAITDHGHCHAHADIFLQGKKQGQKIALGVEAYVIHDLKEWNDLRAKIKVDKDAKKAAKKLEVVDPEDEIPEDRNELTEDMVGKANARALRRKGHLVLLACNRIGLSNIYDLTYKAHKLGFYGKPRMDKEMLRSHSAGVIASSACMGGVISNKCWELKRGECSWEDVVREAKDFDEIFGRGRFFLELQFNEVDAQRYINECLVRIHIETGIPLTVAADAHYIDKDGWKAQEFLYMLRGKLSVSTRGDDWDFGVRQLYIKSPLEMWEAFQKFGGALDPAVAIDAFKNTLLMEELIEDFEPDVTQRLPKTASENPFKELGTKAIDAMKTMGLADNPIYKARLLHELKIIKEKGISNYFLTMDKMVGEAKKIMWVGPGRGSSAGSLLCYLLQITDLDPIANDLMFERFIDPTRVELPDIDVDFEDPDAAKDLLRRTFGEDNVACISSYGTFQIKGLLKDLSRVYDIDHNETNDLNKKINKELRVLHTAGTDKSTIVIKLEDVKRVSKSYNAFVEKYPIVGENISRLYGRNRNVTRHASGVIIGDDLPRETAVFKSKGVVQTSFTDGIVNKNISAMGLVKFDILGLATLQVMHFCAELISKKTGKTVDEIKESLRGHNLDKDDPVVMKKIFWEGNFDGIFQFTEKGIRELAMRVKPDCYEDISAICALYRPGPLGSKMDDLFVENKHNKDNIKYGHPILERLLKNTYGCMIYQEQLLKIGLELGKLPMKDVNRLRKLFLKKDKSKTDEFLENEKKELKGKLVAGCIENGWTAQQGDDLWASIAKFGGYGFNVAHSKSYALITMQTAHLSTYHPLEFAAAVLTVQQSGNMQKHVNDIKKRGIKILPVDVNKSKMSNVVEGDGVRLSLTSVLGVGASAGQKIVDNQPYVDFKDYLKRSKTSKTSIVPLIKVGAFDCIEKNMGLLSKIAEVRFDNKNERYSGKEGRLLRELEQAELYKNPPLDIELVHKIDFENELLGFTLRGTPFEVLGREEKLFNLFDGNVPTYAQFTEGEDDVAVIPVFLKDFNERQQRNGQMMAFMKFTTAQDEEFEAPAFSGIWKWLQPVVKKGTVYLATFNRKHDDDASKLVLGKPGFAHSQNSSIGYMVNVDEIQLEG